MKRSDMRYILFDFDGVLVDTFSFCYSITCELYPERCLTKESFRDLFNGNILKTAGTPSGVAQDRPGIRPDNPFSLRYDPLLMETAPIPGMVDLLHQLHADGRTRLAVVTSTVSSPVELYLDKHGLRPLFDRVYGADVHRSKVAKIEMALRDFGATLDNSIFVTDTLGDLREAAQVGLSGIAVTWGFHPASTLQQGQPLALATTPSELLSSIQMLRP